MKLFAKKLIAVLALVPALAFAAEGGIRWTAHRTATTWRPCRTALKSSSTIA